ncbi:MAG TPA: cyclic nucleotide-binding domain-containing protein [Gammaproteobacteria bacterium]|nr:cyclic nucleotide-binding domain-containing protein [Gammaproteobacteria bacterium]
MAELVDKAILKTLVPPSALNAENFQELAGKTYVEVIPAGKPIFKQGDTDKQAIYVLEGEVTLTSDSGEQTTVAAGTPEAKHPLANQQPRKHTATAKKVAKITRIDSDLLDILLTWDQLSGIEVGEIQVEEDHYENGDEGGDWMTRILQSRAFLQVPPANIQAMFMRIQEVPVKAGQTIIKQGDEGDYYYIIKHGKCKVTRTSKSNTELTLATLKDGDAFGEEALLSDAKRNANIIMETDGSLMRLSKDDFNSLLKEPMLSWVTNEEAEEMVRNGAVWVDVRLESEYKNNGIEGSINIPLFMLRMKAEKLDPSKQYILYCDTGRRSSAGAFLLSERGIKASCLKDGLVARGGEAA